MNLIKKITGGWKKVLGIVLVSALVSQMIAPALMASASGAVFNNNSDDLPMLRGANKSEGDTTWSAPQSGKAGDTFAGIIFYHNSIKDTPAKNTVVRVNLPAQTTGNKLVIGASISADNFTTVSSTMDVNLDQNAKVSIIPGTVQWFPSFKTFNTPPAGLLHGQTGNELFGPTGLNLGEIKVCWDYRGFVVFQFKTEKLPAANIIESKIAKNLVTGAEGVNISANPGDEVLYTLTTKNTGNAATDLTVTDDISDILELADFVSASVGGTLSNSIIRYPTVRIAAGETNVRTFKVKVKNPQPTTAQNGKHFDGIMENVYGNLVFVNIGKIIPGKPSLRIEKSVRNVTINESGFSKENQAKPGDVLEYQIFFANSGEKALNITISDVLPANVSFVKGSASLSRNGTKSVLTDKALFDGFELAQLDKDEDGIITFKVKVSSGIATGEILINTATLWFNKQALNDTARTKIVVTPIPVTPGLPMTGPSTALSLLFTLTGILSIYYIKSKKILSLLGK